jgi:hypothetical protein
LQARCRCPCRRMPYAQGWQYSQGLKLLFEEFQGDHAYE